mmetsp:Transcript_85338/g.275424  ORF Transcript_85338/g.275424 Transcript_85338/m.275424 type:complete len:267 (+) Transcript_85338:500-1300(+)
MSRGSKKLSHEKSHTFGASLCNHLSMKSVCPLVSLFPELKAGNLGSRMSKLPIATPKPWRFAVTLAWATKSRRSSIPRGPLATGAIILARSRRLVVTNRTNAEASVPATAAKRRQAPDKADHTVRGDRQTDSPQSHKTQQPAKSNDTCVSGLFQVAGVSKRRSILIEEVPSPSHNVSAAKLELSSSGPFASRTHAFINLSGQALKSCFRPPARLKSEPSIESKSCAISWEVMLLMAAAALCPKRPEKSSGVKSRALWLEITYPYLS